MWQQETARIADLERAALPLRVARLDLSVMTAFFARSHLVDAARREMDKRTPIPFLRSRPFFQSSWFKPIWVLPARSITPSSVPFSSHRSSIAKPSAS